MKLPTWPVPLGKKPIDLGLHRMFKALELCGNPQNKLPPVIHFAGTNGKGSTISFIKAMIEADGKTCHVYTSPHLVEFNERIVLAGKTIPDKFLSELIEETKSKCESLNMPFFEGTTLIAINAFSRVTADYLLLETGLGGRLDATNFMGQNGLPDPHLTVITTISKDHQEFLGETITEIAGEKAGIIKKNIKCISSKQVEEASIKIGEVAKIRNSDLIEQGKDFSFSTYDDKSWDFIDHKSNSKTKLPKLSLVGEHQYINATTAVAVAKEIGLAEKAIIKGLQNAKWSARLQKLSDDIYLDGGHNEDASKALYKYFEESDKKIIILMAMLKDKDFESYIMNIKNCVSEFVFTEIPNEINSQKSKKLKDFCDKNEIKSTSINNFEAALEFAKNKQRKILICGSLYLAGYVLENNLK